MSGQTDIREAIIALEARRIELESLIAEDLERRFFASNEEIVETVTNRGASESAIFSQARMVNTGCGSHFTMTWFAVSTS